MALFRSKDEARNEDRERRGLPKIRVAPNGGVYVLGEDLVKSKVFKDRLAEAAKVDLGALRRVEGRTGPLGSESKTGE